MGEQARLFNPRRYFRYRVVPARAPGVAARQAPQRQVSAHRRAVQLERLQRIGGTGRSEAAARTQPGAEQQAIALHQGNQRSADHGAARANNSCSSARTARLSASEVALSNCMRSKPARSRTTWAATGSGGSTVWLTV